MYVLTGDLDLGDLGCLTLEYLFIILLKHLIEFARYLVITHYLISYLFWNQIFICLSLRAREWDNSMRLQLETQAINYM